MNIIYYVGIGSFGYAVFYDSKNQQIRVSRNFETFQEARTLLIKLQS